MMAGRQRRNLGKSSPRAHPGPCMPTASKSKALCQARSQWEHPDPIPNGEEQGLSQALNCLGTSLHCLCVPMARTKPGRKSAALTGMKHQFGVCFPSLNLRATAVPKVPCNMLSEAVLQIGTHPTLRTIKAIMSTPAAGTQPHRAFTAGEIKSTSALWRVPSAHIFTRWIFLSQFKVRNNIQIESDRVTPGETDLSILRQGRKRGQGREKTGPFDATCQSQSWLAAFIATLENSEFMQDLH